MACSTPPLLKRQRSLYTEFPQSFFKIRTNFHKHTKIYLFCTLKKYFCVTARVRVRSEQIKTVFIHSLLIKNYQ